MKGFTLIEMLVSIAIFTIVTSIVIYNYGAFNSNIQVTNLAYEMALAIRQAQVYGLSVKTIPGQSNPNYAYGMYFNINDTKKFYLYADKNGSPNGAIDGGVSSCGEVTSECQEEFTIRGDVSITKLCIYGTDRSGCTDDELNIVFLRPNPEAVIFPENTIGIDALTGRFTANNTAAEITIKGQRSGKEKVIRVDRTGQISVQ